MLLLGGFIYFGFCLIIGCVLVLLDLLLTGIGFVDVIVVCCDCVLFAVVGCSGSFTCMFLRLRLLVLHWFALLVVWFCRLAVVYLCWWVVACGYLVLGLLWFDCCWLSRVTYRLVWAGFVCWLLLVRGFDCVGWFICCVLI